MKQGLDSYDSGTKATWRGWQWNRIVERLPEFRDRKGPIPINNTTRAICAEKTVVYLCGPDDADREHGRRFGFRDENMIAVDIDESNVAIVKQNPIANGIDMPLQELLLAWPKDWPLDVVIADLCSGLDASSIGVLSSLIASNAVHTKTVASVNLQRGREQPGSLFHQCRDFFNEMSEERKLLANRQAADGIPFAHRGRLFFVEAVNTVCTTRNIDLPTIGDAQKFCDTFKPVCNSYLSPPSYRIRMDSCIFIMGLLALGHYDADSALGISVGTLSKSRLKQLIDDPNGVGIAFDEVERKKADNIRRITAMRAVRTMKINRMVKALSV